MYLETKRAPGVERLERSTLAVLAGRDTSTGEPLNQPPVFASAFRAGSERGYSRDGNPTWEAFEQAIGALEGGVAVSFSSGMAAVAATLEGLAPDARVVIAGSAYAEVLALVSRRAARGALRMTRVDVADEEAVLGALPGADLLWLDAISNPTLDVPRLDLLAAAAREHGVCVVVDSTLATPVLLRPLELGADLVLHSATKHIGGHSDLMLGVAVARDESIAGELRAARTTLGAVPGTMDAWLALRGLRTLPVRIDRGQQTAALLASRLAAHPAVASVRYPGLSGDPSHPAARALLDGFGTMLCFVPAGGEGAADSVCEQVRVLTHATSLGGVETLIERPGRWRCAEDVPRGLLRVSAGCEDADDLWRDLERAISVSAY